MRRTALALPLTCAVVLLSACSGSDGGAASSGASSAATAASSAVSPSGTRSSSTGSTGTGSTGTGSASASASTTPAAPVALPAGHHWLPVTALHQRLAVPDSWKVVDLSRLRDQQGTPAFATTASSLGYSTQEMEAFVASGATAMAVGPDQGQTAPNLLVRAVSGGTFTSGDQLTSQSRGATGHLDAQSRPTTPAGPAVRGDFHAVEDGMTVYSSQLAVSVDGAQHVVTVSAADAATVRAVMDTVVRTYSHA